MFGEEGPRFFKYRGPICEMIMNDDGLTGEVFYQRPFVLDLGPFEVVGIIIIAEAKDV